MTTPTPKPRWHHLTPTRFFVGLLVMQVFLLASERFQWFAFNERKGWTVLIAVGVVGVSVLVMLIWGLVCLCLRRRFQFGFRSLLLFVVAASVPMGWFASKMQRARRQREAVERIRELGGRVTYDYVSAADLIRMVVLGRKPEPPMPQWLRDSVGIDFFYDVTDVDCRSTALCDENAGLLNELTRLESLFLFDTQISDDGLVHVKGMIELEELWLNGTLVSDNGLSHVGGMTNLRFLYLDHTQITDMGLPYFEGLTKLQRLTLYCTDVTDDGVRTLQQALPNCEIHH